jgi:hypothetical protein
MMLSLLEAEEEEEAVSEQNGGLTLEELVRRLEAMERENAELRGEVATLKGSGTPGEEPTVRRGPRRLARR